MIRHLLTLIMLSTGCVNRPINHHSSLDSGVDVVQVRALTLPTKADEARAIALPLDSTTGTDNAMGKVYALWHEALPKFAPGANLPRRLEEAAWYLSAYCCLLGSRLVLPLSALADSVGDTPLMAVEATVLGVGPITQLDDRTRRIRLGLGLDPITLRSVLAEPFAIYLNTVQPALAHVIDRDGVDGVSTEELMGGATWQEWLRGDLSSGQLSLVLDLDLERIDTE